MSQSNITANPSSILNSVLARIITIILCIVTIITGGAKLGEVKLEVSEPVTTETQIIEFKMTNYSVKRICTGEDFNLEVNKNGEWEQVTFTDDYYWNAIGIYIDNFQTIDFKINVIEAFGKPLDEGEYRLTKEFDGKTCFVDFTVTQA